MPNADLRDIDVAVLHALRRLDRPVTPTDLEPLLREAFPDNDEIDMREGIALTRLRGRGLVEIDVEGRVHLTTDGVAAAGDL